MSLADELNKIGDYGYIKLTDLVIGQKYKVLALKAYESTLNNLNRKCLRVDIDDGYLLMPERYDKKVATIDSANVENLYVMYNGRQKGNRFDIHFVEEKAA